MRNLVAYPLYEDDPMLIEPAAPSREWMDATPNRFANRCLPMLVANQSGWVLRQVGTFSAVWSGSRTPHDVHIHRGGNSGWFPEGHFGGGILTWTIPWLFRTPKGYNLLIRGPINEPKDGVAPLEGLIESDWMTQSTTYSVKLTRPRLSVTYKTGDTVAVIVPVKRNDLETWVPSFREMPANVRSELDDFSKARANFLDSDRGPRDFEGHYSRGKSPGGSTAPTGEHTKRRHLKPFQKEGNA